MEALASVSYTSCSFFYSFFHAWSGNWLNQIAPPDSANLLPVHIMEVGLKGKFQLIWPCAMLFAGDCILPHGYAFYICFKSNSVPI